jgi:general secretion pathway protein H
MQRPSRRGANPARKAGFTLLEVIVVLVLGAILYAIVLAVPMRGASASDLKAAARALASGLRQAQSTGMATRRDAALVLDVEAREYSMPGEATARRLPENIDLKLFTAQSEVSSASKGAIRFYPDGSSTGGRITLASGERQFLVDVNWLTGRVSIGD